MFRVSARDAGHGILATALAVVSWGCAQGTRSPNLVVEKRHLEVNGDSFETHEVETDEVLLQYDLHNEGKTEQKEHQTALCD
jgi:hypothetical protein